MNSNLLVEHAFFSGSYTVLLDEKRRVLLPADLRKIVPGQHQEFWLTLLLPEKCVGIYQGGEWQRLPLLMREERLRNDTPEVRERQRRVLEHTSRVPIDKAGRITLNSGIIDAARLRSKVLVIGNLDHLELWSPEGRKEYMDSLRFSSADSQSLFPVDESALRAEGSESVSTDEHAPR